MKNCKVLYCIYSWRTVDYNESSLELGQSAVNRFVTRAVRETADERTQHSALSTRPLRRGIILRFFDESSEKSCLDDLCILI